MTELQHIIPRPGEIRPVKPYKIPDERWREFLEKHYGSGELPGTIKFSHDVDWDRRFWSIQNVANQKDGHHLGFWSFIGLLLFLSDIGWYFVRLHH